MSLTWRIKDRDGYRTVDFAGEIDENTDFSELSGQLNGSVVFNLQQVKRINSCGVREWVNFIRNLPGVTELTFTKCDPASGIAYDMAFIYEGDRSPATSAMTYEKAEGGGTKVTWTMEGDVGTMAPPVVAGYMNAFVMKGSIGGMFEKGLEKLKASAEAK